MTKREFQVGDRVHLEGHPFFKGTVMVVRDTHYPIEVMWDHDHSRSGYTHKRLRLISAVDRLGDLA